MTDRDRVAVVDEPLVETLRRRKTREDSRPKRQPRYHVILWDDNDHSYDYVIGMMRMLFGHAVEKGCQIAKEVDSQGRAICLTTTLEHAELKRDQIHAYGKDSLIARVRGFDVFLNRTRIRVGGMGPRIKTYTLGCKVNQYETEFVRQGLLGIGYQDAGEHDQADLCIVNTCTVTQEGDAKSRQAIRRLARDNPHARIVVMGCYATRAPAELAVLPGVSEVLTDKRELPDLLGRFGVVDIPSGISQFGSRHRAYLKVQDGCLLRCNYCIIPHVRPHVISRGVPEILDEVRRLLDNGYREFVLTGVHLGHYGVEQNRGKAKTTWLRLSHLVRELVAVEGDFRLRLSSIEATEVTRELVDIVAECPDKICPHFHICLQSGSDRVLRRMGRRWAARMFVDRCRLVQDRLTLPALTTDVIVGFPGETEEDFQTTCQLVREIGFSKIHIFPFSTRRGTPAADMPDHVSKSDKADRSQRLAEIERELRRNYFQRLVGRPLRVLIESGVDGGADGCSGTSCRYAPVELPTTRASSGQLVSCVPYAADDRRLLA